MSKRVLSDKESGYFSSDEASRKKLKSHHMATRSGRVYTPEEFGIHNSNATPTGSAPMDTTQQAGASAAAAAGGASGGGDMPVTSFNNPYSGHLVISVPDSMTAPAVVNYRQLWIVAKIQHPLLQLITDFVEADLSDQIYFTPIKVEFYGAAAGVISLQPYIQRCGTTIHYPAAPLTTRSNVVGQQLVDTGTLTKKPYLSHNFGDSPENTRMVNLTPVTADNANTDILFKYQYVQKATAPVPIDSGYLRISFILRNNVFVDLTGGIPASLDLVSETHVKLVEKSRKRTKEHDQMIKVDKIKRLTMPVSDSR